MSLFFNLNTTILIFLFSFNKLQFMIFKLKPAVFLILLFMSCQSGKLTVVGSIDSDLKEASAAEIVNHTNIVWTIEDAGNKNNVYGLDLKGNIRLYNPNFGKMFQVDLEEQAINHIDQLLLKVDLLIPPPNEFSNKLESSLLMPEHQSIIEFKTKFGRTIEAYSNPQKKFSEVIGQVWSFRDISDLKLKEEEARHRAYHDLLTGLPNRRLLANRLDDALNKAKSSGNLTIVLFIDLDGFKDVNDSLGHGVGDSLLKSITNRLEKLLPDNCLLSRHGGDEFIAVMAKQENSKAAQEFAKAIVESFNTPFHLGEEAIYMSASIGIAIAPVHGSNSERLISHADIAMYQAKKRGKNTFVIYDEELNSQPAYRLKVRNQINIALEQKQFELYFQPKVCLETGTIKGAEALIRWRQKNGSFRSPLEFIPIAEESDLIIDIGMWVLEQSCKYMDKWQNMGLLLPELSVNVSAKQFHHPEFAERVEELMSRYHIDSAMLNLEVTESVVLGHAEDTIRKMEQLKELGLRFSIDDFGAGYSSLSYLKRLPVDELKIDRSFIQHMETNESSIALVRAIITMASHLNVKVVAEGVESVEQYQALQQLGCNIFQGFYFSKPLTHEELIEFVQNEGVGVRTPLAG